MKDAKDREDDQDRVDHFQDGPEDFCNAGKLECGDGKSDGEGSDEG